MENLRLFMGTYNVGTSIPPTDLEIFLDLNTERKKEKYPDFYIISLQEVKSQPQSMLFDVLFDETWTYMFKQILVDNGYVKVKTVRLQGLVLSVYCLRKHLLNIRDIESGYTRTGLSGMWGNKGAVSIRLGIYGCSLCFVNSHLSAHDNHLKYRIDDYNSIIKDQEFHVPEHKEIFYHDYVFWMGDLNFRLMEEFDQSPEEIDCMIKKKEFNKLFAYDQLRYVMNRGEAFSELKEKDPDFPPTYKFEIGTNDYDYKRRPAWCDRILYKVNTNNYENVTLKADQLSYKSLSQYVGSDHKPVIAEFTIKIPRERRLLRSVSVDQVFSDYEERVVEFDNITGWLQDEDNTAKFIFTKNIVINKEDWIGLFKENFIGLDDYVCYEYVKNCCSPSPETSPKSPRKFQTSQQPIKYSATFSDLPGRCRGNYCLIYFSENEDKVTSVLGISNLFPITQREID